MFRPSSIAPLISLCFIPCSANADIVFDLFFRPSGGIAAIDSTLVVPPSTMLSGVEVVLRETVSGGMTSVIGAANINSYNAAIAASGSDGTFQDLTLDATGGFAAGSNGPTQLNYAAIGAGFGQPGRAAADIGGGVHEVVLGTVKLNGPSIGSTMFLVSDADMLDGDFTTFGTVAGLESAATSFNNRAFTLSTTAVPEPSAWLFMSLLGCVVACHNRWRRLRRGPGLGIRDSGFGVRGSGFGVQP